MSEKLAVAEKNMKDINQEITIWSNRLASMKNDLDGLQKQKEELEGQIARQKNDTQTWLDAQRSLLKKQENAHSEERKKIAQAKAELETMVAEATAIKIEAQNAKSEAEKIGNIVQSRKNKLDNFVVSVQRAYSLVE
jgi:predicted  nucleic acid-binding Zn-ribbon protein